MFPFLSCLIIYNRFLIPGAVVASGVTKTSATVQWTNGATNGKPIIKYIIAGRTNWNQTWVNISTGNYYKIFI